MNRRSGKVLISYSHADATVATKIHSALVTAGIPTWIDRVEVRPGDSFVDEINKALSESSYVLLVVSRNSLASRWVQREWMSALAADGTLVIPILLEHCEVPPILRDIQYVDLTDFEVGIKKIVSFFTDEFSDAPTGKKAFAGNLVDVSKLSRRDLRLVAQRCITDLDLQSFLYDAGIEPGLIAGLSLHDRLVSLLHHVSREGLIETFAVWLTIEKTRCVELAIASIRKQPQWSAHS